MAGRGERRAERDSGLQPGARQETAGGNEGVGRGVSEGPETPRGTEKKPRCPRKIPLHEEKTEEIIRHLVVFSSLLTKRLLTS
jgi:hypothetical protein